MKLALFIVPILITIPIFGIYIFQDKLIYFPRLYNAAYFSFRPPCMTEISYETGEGLQTAFYVPPKKDPQKIPDRIWMVFSGNAALALDWLVFVSRFPGEETAFFLFDYPGYGKSKGRPGVKSIFDSSKKAFKKLASRLNLSAEELESRSGVLGQSLGAGAALQFATERKVDPIILISPFTSMTDMATRAFGKPLSLLLKGDFDNRSAIKKIGRERKKRNIVIFHGDLDEIVPVQMGRKLAGEIPDVLYREIPGAMHNDIMSMAERDVVNAMIRLGS